MSDHEPTELDEDLTPAELAALDAFLTEPAMWDEPDADLEDDVVAAITARAGGEAPGADAVPLSRPSARRSSPRRSRAAGLLPLVAIAAAVAVLVVLAAGFFEGVADRSGEAALALAPPAGAPPLAPGATGDARMDERGDGTRIRLDVRGLPPAPPGFYYEAWMRKSPQVGVSAGTFHLREGGQETIELWSGVSPRDYPLFTVTIQEEARPESSGKVLLSGRVG